MNIHTIPDTLNHVTLNTGHMRQSPHSEIDVAVLFELNRYAQDALREVGVEVADNIFFQAVQKDDMYIGTLFLRYDTVSCPVPFLVTGGAKTEEGGRLLWTMLHKNDFGDKQVMKMSIFDMPQVPFIADRLIMNQALQDCGFIGPSGDFCRCMGWMYLYPDLLKKAAESP